MGKKKSALKQKNEVVVDKQKGFSVYVDDNFNSMPDYSSDEYDVLREDKSTRPFSTYEQAVVEAQKIVRSSLRECFERNMTRTQLMKQYKNFGADPFIVPRNEKGVQFSAWNYANDIADQVLKEKASS